jgi:non-ribosomal peptide synthetase component F
MFQQSLIKPNVYVLQVLFQYFEHSSSNIELPWGHGAHSRQFPGHLKRETAQLDLTIEIEERTIHTYYSAELFEATTIHRMMDSYMQLLQQLAEAPDTPVGAASVLQDSVEQQLLSWGAGKEQVDQLQAPLAHEAFLTAAAAAPDSCCLAFEGSSLSYQTVKQRAMGLAQQLQAAGVGPGVAVGVLLERSLELPIAVLAVFMAGGCYVPLDPSYPEQRLQGYLADAGAAALVTSGRLANMSAAVAGASGVQVKPVCP